MTGDKKLSLSWHASVVIFLVALTSLFGFLLNAFSVNQANAAIPTTLGYQGRLKNASGTALTGTYNFIFRMYASSTGGVPVWNETQSVSVDQSFFAVQLGAVTPFPATLDFNQPLYVTTEVAGDGEMAPRVPINSVAYAYTSGGVNAFSSAPVSATGGRMYYDTSSASLFFFDGLASVWRQLGSASSTFQNVTAAGNITTDAIQFAGGTSTGDFNPDIDLAYSLGGSANRWNANLGAVSSTSLFANTGTFTDAAIGDATISDGIITNGTITNLSFTNGTSTSWFGFASASGTDLYALNLTGSNINSVSATATNFFATNATVQNLTITGVTPSNIDNLAWNNATGTNTTSTNLAVSTYARLPGDTLINNTQVCLFDGTNCPTSGGGGADATWFDSANFGFIRPVTTTRDVVIGASATATAPFYFDVSAPSSSLQIGRSGNADLFVGTSTYGGGLDPAFVMDGKSVFAQGSVGVMGWFYTPNGVAVGTGTTLYTDGGITKNNGNLVLQTSGGFIVPQTDLGQTLGTVSQRFNGNFGDVTVVNATSSNMFATNANFTNLSVSNATFTSITVSSTIPSVFQSLAWTNASGTNTTSTSWFGFNVASGTSIFASNISVNGSSVCLLNGTNCPVGGMPDLQAVTNAGNSTTNTIQFAGGTSTGSFNPDSDLARSLGIATNRWNAYLGSVTGASANITDLISANSTSTNSFVTNGTVSNLTFTNGTSTDWFGFSVASGTSLYAANVTAGDFVSSNATSTNLYATNATIQNLNVTGAAPSNFENLTWTNATGTNTSLTNLAVSGNLILPNNSVTDAMVVNNLTIDATGNIAADAVNSGTLGSGAVTLAIGNFGTITGTLGDANIANALTITSGTVNNTPIGDITPSTGVFTNATATNLFATNGRFDNLFIDTSNPTNLNFVNGTSSNWFGFATASGTNLFGINGFISNLTANDSTSTNFFATNATIQNLTVTGLAPSNFDNLVWLNATGTNTTSTNLYASVGKFGDLVADSATFTHMVVMQDSNIQNLTFMNATGQNLNTYGTVSSSFIYAGDTVLGNTTAHNMVVDQTLKVGEGNFQVLGNSVAQFGGSTDTYLQVNIQNTSNGTSASSDFVATNDIGDDSSYYIDMGINSSNYNVPGYSISGPNDGYLVTFGNNLTIGTASASTAVIFHAGGTTAADEVMRLTTDHYVGIGTTAPSSTFHVVGDSIMDGTLTVTTASATQLFFADATGTSLWINSLARLPANTQINNTAVCLLDGTNCPSGTSPNFQTVTNTGNTTTRDIAFNGGTSTGSFTIQGNLTVTGTTALQSLTFANATGYYIDFFPTTSSPPLVQGRLFYDDVQDALAYYNDLSSSPIEIGREVSLHVRNLSGSGISRGQVVRIVGNDGSGFPTIELAMADATSTVNATGLASTDIPNGSTGDIIVVGTITNFDTSAFSDGDVVYLSATVPGGLTNVRPPTPNITLELGIITDADATQGKILVHFITPKFGAIATGAVTFGDTNNFITNDAANLYWDNATKRLGIGTNTPAFTLDVSGTTQLRDFTFTYATGASVTSTNLYVVNGTIANSTSTYSYVTNGTVTNLSFANGTSTDWLGFNVASGTTINALTGNFNSLNSSNVNLTGGNINNVAIGNVTPSTGVFTDSSSTNLYATNATFDNLNVTGAFPSNFSNITWTNATGTNTNLTNLSVAGTLTLPNNSVTDVMVANNLTIDATGNIAADAVNSGTLGNGAVTLAIGNFGTITGTLTDANISNILTLSSSTIDNSPIGSIAPSTGVFTNATSSNLFATNGTFTNGVMTNGTVSNLSFTNGTSSNWLGFATASGTAVNALTGNFNNLNSSNVALTGGTINGISIGAVTPSTAVFTNSTSTNLFATNATIQNLTVTGAAPSNFDNLVWLNATGTNTHLTYLVAEYATLTHGVVTSDLIASGNANVQNLTFVNATGQNLNTYGTVSSSFINAGDTVLGNTTAHTMIVDQALKVGAGNFPVIGNSVAQFGGDIDGTLQVNIQNHSSGTNASGEFGVTADNGDDGSYYTVMGITSSNFSSPLYPIAGPNDGFMFTNGANLIVGSASSGTVTKFVVGGASVADEVMRITSDHFVGIGTTAPSSTLHVVGDSRIDGTLTVTTASATQLFWADATGTSLLVNTLARLPANTQINNTAVCLLDGTNCPSGTVTNLQAATNAGNTTTNAIQFAGGTSTGDFNPDLDLTRNLGSAADRWNQVFAGTLVSNFVSSTNVSSTNLSVLGLSNLANVLFINATGTNLEVLGLFTAATANVTNLTSTNSTSTNLYAENGTIDNLTGTNSSFTNSTSTNLYATNANIDGLFSASTTINSLTVGVLNVTSTAPSFFQNLSWANATGVNTTSTFLYAVNGVMDNATTTNSFVTNGTVSNLTFTNGTSTDWFGFNVASGTTLNALTVNAANLTSPNVTLTGGTIDGTAIGSVSPSTAVFTYSTSTNLYASNATIQNLNVTGAAPSNFTNLTWTNATGTNTNLTNLSVNGTLALPNSSVTDAMVANNLTIDATGNIAADAVNSGTLGSGAVTLAIGSFGLITGTLGDANVANALTIDGGTINNTPIGAITPSTGIFTNVTSSVLYVTDANIQNLIVTGATPSNFDNLTWLNATGTNTTSTNLYATLGRFGDLVALNSTTTNLDVTGMSSIQNLTFNNASGGNLTTFGTVSSSLIRTGNITMNDATAHNMVVDESLRVGVGSFPIIGNSVAQFGGTTDTYLQVNVQNHSDGTNASTDFVATNDIGDDSSYYVDLGINSSGYNNLDFSIGGPNDAYLVANSNNLTIGTASASTAVIFHAGGTTAADEVLRITSDHYVGIGTTSPSTTFHVVGDSRIDGTLTVTTASATQLFWADATGTNLWVNALARLPSDTKINDTSVCLLDGTNCPSGTTPSFQTVTNTGNTTTNAIVFNGGTSTGSFVIGANLTVTGTTDLKDLAFVNATGQYMDFTTSTAAPSYLEGRLFYDVAEHSLAYYNDTSNITLDIGQETLVRVENGTGSTITNGQLVYVSGADGGYAPRVGLSKADATSTAFVLGMATQNIAPGAKGYVTRFGIVHNLDTSALSPGVQLYLSDSVAGGVTTVRPSAPSVTVLVGEVTKQHLTDGSILINPAAPTNGKIENGGLAFGTNSFMTDDAANLFWDNANNRLGIGTNAPSTTLDVVGDARVSGALTVGTASSSVLFYGNATGTSLYAANFYATSLARLPSNTQINNTAVCLLDGTNCPSGTTPSFQTVTNTGNTTTNSIVVFGGISTSNLTATGTTALQGLTWDNATASSVTTTNLFATNATIQNLNLTGATPSNFSNVIWINATGTYTTSTELAVLAIARLPSDTKINNKAVCLLDGTNCPSTASPDFQTVTNTGNTTTHSIAVYGGITTSNLTATGTTSLQGLTLDNATASSVTTTNLFAAIANLTSLSFTNGTSTNWLGFATASGTTLNAITVNAANLASPNVTFTGGTIDGIAIGSVTPSTGVFTSVTSTNSTSTNLFATNATINNLTLTGTTPSNFTNIIWTNATGTNTTSTNLFATNGIFTNQVVTNSVVSNSTSTSWFGFATASGTTLNAINLTAANFDAATADLGALTVTGNTSLQRLTFTQATATSVTTTNLAVTGGLSLPNNSVTDVMVANNLTIDATGSINANAINSGTLGNGGVTLAIGSFGSITGTLGDSNITDVLTVNGGTINNTPIGNLTPSTGIFTNTTSTNSTSTNLFATNATINNLTVTGAAPSNFTNLSWTNATGTNTTSTNLFATNGTFTNGVMTNGTVSNLTFTNGTSSNWFGFATASGTTLNAITGRINNFTSNNVILTGGTINGISIGAVTPSTGIFTNTTSTNSTSTNLFATNATIANLTVTGAAPSNFTNLSWTNATGTNTTSTNLFASNFTATNSTLANATSTGWFGFATASGTSLFASAISVNGSSVCLLDGTNCRAQTLQSATNNGATTTNTLGLYGGFIAASSTVTSTFTVLGSTSLQGLTFTNGTSNNWLGFATASGTNINALNAFLANLNSTNATTINLGVSGNVSTNLLPNADAALSLGSSALRWNGVFANTTSTNATSTNLFATNATISNLTLNGSTPSSFTNVLWTNATGTNTTSTNLFATNFRATNEIVTNSTISNLVFTVATGTSVTTTNLAVTGGLSLPNNSVTDAMVSNTLTIDATGNINAGAINSGTLGNGGVTLALGNFGGITGTLGDTNVADNLTINGGTINNSPIGAVTPSTGVFTNVTSTNSTSTGWFGFATASGTTLNARNSNLNNLVWVNATGTNTTSTNLFATNGTFTNGVMTNGTISNLTFTNGTSSNWFGFAVASGTTLNVLNGTVNNFISSNATISGGSINGTPIGNSVASTGIFTNTTSTNSTSTNLFATNATIQNLTVTGAAPSNFTNLSWTNATGTNTTSTNLFASNFMATNGTLVNVTSTGWLGFATASGTNVNALNAFFASLNSPNATLSGGTINGMAIGGTVASTGIFTNTTSTNATTTNLAVSGNVNTNLIPRVDAVLSLGSAAFRWDAYLDTVTSTSATTTNLFATNATIANLTLNGTTPSNFTNIIWTNATGTNTTSTNLFATNLTGTNGSLTNVTSTGWLGFTTASGTTLNARNANLNNLVWVNATGTNTTSTNLFATNGTFTNGVMTNGTVTNLSFTVATGTSVTTTNLAVTGGLSLPNNSVTDAMVSNTLTIDATGNINAGAINSGTLGNGGVTLALGNFGGITGTLGDTNVADNLTINGGTINNSPIGVVTPSTGVFTNVTSTNSTSTGWFGFTTASGTTLNAAAISVNGSSVCLLNGTNCPANTNPTLQTVTNNGSTTTRTLGLFGGFLAASSTVTSTFTVLGNTSLQGLTFVNGTSSNWLGFTTASGTSLIARTLNVSGAVAFGDGFIFGNATGTNVTTTGLAVNGLVGTSLIPRLDSILALGTSALRWNGNFGSVTTTNLVANNVTTTALNFTTASGTNLNVTNFSFINATATNWRVLGSVGVGVNPVVNGNNIFQINTSNIIPTLTDPFSAFEIDSDDGTKSDFVFRLSSSTAAGYPSMTFSRSDGTLAVPTVVPNGMIEGSFNFMAFDGATFHNGAEIRATVDTGTIGVDQTPTKLTFLTAPDAVGAPIERMVISSNGFIGIASSTPTYPLSVSGTGSFTDLLVGGKKVCLDDGTNCKPNSIWSSSTTAAITLTTTEKLILTVTSTPSSVNNQVWVTVNSGVSMPSTANITITLRIRRKVCTTGVQVGTDVTGDVSRSAQGMAMTASFVDSPATTTAVGYVVCMRTSGSSPTTEPTQATAHEVKTGADLGEVYYSHDNNLQPGTVVSLDPSMKDGVKRTDVQYDEQAIGVVSTQAGQVMSAAPLEEGTSPVIVALTGRVPVKASNENGAIMQGDPLTSASTTGYAMKATSAGAIIGRAMQTLEVPEGTATSSAMGSVMMFVQPGYYFGSNGKDTLGQMAGFMGSTGTTQLFEKAASGDLQAILESVGGTINPQVSAGSQTFEDVAFANIGVLVVRTAAVIAGDLTVGGLVRMTGHMVVSSDTAGVVDMPIGESYVEVKFTKPYEDVPVVVVTPESDAQEYFTPWLGKFRVAKKTVDGFRIEVDEGACIDPSNCGRTLRFNWMAVGIPKTATSTAEVPQPEPEVVVPTSTPTVETPPAETVTPPAEDPPVETPPAETVTPPAETPPAETVTPPAETPPAETPPAEIVTPPAETPPAETPPANP